MRSTNVTSAVKDDVVHNGNSTMELLLKQIIRTVVGPVGEQSWLESFVKSGTAWAVNGQGTSNPIGILKSVMAMVPGVAILRGAELVGEGVVKCNRALGNP